MRCASPARCQLSWYSKQASINSPVSLAVCSSLNSFFTTGWRSPRLRLRTLGFKSASLPELR